MMTLDFRWWTHSEGSNGDPGSLAVNHTVPGLMAYYWLAWHILSGVARKMVQDIN